MPIKLDHTNQAAFEAVLPAIAAFKRSFKRDLSPGFVAELYAARELNLALADGANESGADGTDSAGCRYEIKLRTASTLNVDLNGFNFDELVLVNLDDEYQLGSDSSLGTRSSARPRATRLWRNTPKTSTFQVISCSGGGSLPAFTSCLASMCPAIMCGLLRHTIPIPRSGPQT